MLIVPMTLELVEQQRFIYTFMKVILYMVMVQRGLTNLPSTSINCEIMQITDVITGGSGVNLNGEANLTFDGSTLGITGSIDLSADIDVDGTANLDILDVDGASNFGADVSLVALVLQHNITFDAVSA